MSDHRVVGFCAQPLDLDLTMTDKDWYFFKIEERNKRVGTKKKS